jgi:hypothetical protein
MPTITWERENEDGDVELHELPAYWAICSTCNGDGKHSLHLGAITEEDRANDWSPDEFEDYCRGGYDRLCEDCDGKGKVLFVDPKTCPKDLLEAYDAHLELEEEERRSDSITAYWESGGSMGSRTGSRW